MRATRGGLHDRHVERRRRGRTGEHLVAERTGERLQRQSGSARAPSVSISVGCHSSEPAGRAEQLRHDRRAVSDEPRLDRQRGPGLHARVAGCDVEDDVRREQHQRDGVERLPCRVTRERRACRRRAAQASAARDAAPANRVARNDHRGVDAPRPPSPRRESSRRPAPDDRPASRVVATSTALTSRSSSDASALR